jgi:hypothetical protein
VAKTTSEKNAEREAAAEDAQAELTDEAAAAAPDAEPASEETTTEPATAEPPAESPPEPQVASSEPTFTKARLLGPDGELATGYAAHVLAGALHDAQDDEEFTVADAKRRAETFLNRTVTADNVAEEV